MPILPLDKSSLHYSYVLVYLWLWTMFMTVDFHMKELFWNELL